MKTKPLLASLLFASLCACYPAPDVEPFVCRNPQPADATLGTGDKVKGFKPLNDGDDLMVALGPQGLYMITPSLKLKHFEMPVIGTSNTRVSVTVRRQGTLLGGIEVSTPPDKLDEPDTIAFLGVQMPFTTEETSAYLGSPMMTDVAMSLVDGCGRRITSTRSVRLVK